MDFTAKTINELINEEFACSCGKKHIANIEHIAIGKNALEKLESFIDSQTLNNGAIFQKSKDSILVVSDANTRKVAGEKILNRLKENGYLATEYCFQNNAIHAEDECVEELQNHLPKDTSLIITVGSGSLNDITRYVAFHAEIPYYIIATAPSMDGYSSNVSPLIHNNLKITYECKCANAIIGDTDIMTTCPTKMVGAGLGDIIGKYIAINDWRMSRIITGEYCCDPVCDLVLYSVQKCVDNVPGLQRREPEAFQYLMESLVLIGIAMSYIGFSRPASSSEHHIAHFLEMKAIFNGEYGELHGTNVGMATCLVSQMYEKFLTMEIDFDKARAAAKNFDHEHWTAEINRAYGSAAPEVLKVEASAHQNDPENVIRRIHAIEANYTQIRTMIEKLVADTKKAPELLTSLEGLITPKGYNLTTNDIRDVLRYAKELRSRYAALQFFYDLGVLDELTDFILKKHLEV